MKTAALALLLAAAASAQQATIKFELFPATGVACPNQDASGNVTSITADLKAVAVAARNKTPVDKSASNVSSGKCTKMRSIPYYVTRSYQTNGEPAGDVYFAYDEKNSTIYFCRATGPFSTNGSGYPDNCEEY
ncbi:hypothetical protein MPH_12354 [Macrophomina phaseolina MS6]|uniref:AA1-like domain-containing protein n=1 Tax=Macrophomina phaseolina (strain MS6) TaxID=1126212 RepID=K2QL01_MACPH|nr:hypothetical protein MPH_12354 [Macrophomina phaseolina MS6]